MAYQPSISSKRRKKRRLAIIVCVIVRFMTGVGVSVMAAILLRLWTKVARTSSISVADGGSSGGPVMTAVQETAISNIPAVLRIYKKEAKTAGGYSIEPRCSESLSWITSQRYGNANEAVLFETSLRQALIDYPTALMNDLNKNYTNILDDMICLTNSPLRWPQDRKAWRIRLVYLALYHHQHGPARREARQRRKSCLSNLDRHGVGPFDYECTGAKFLVVNLGGVGLGANFRSGAVKAFLAGLAMNRIVIFMSNVTFSNGLVGPPTLQYPWTLASCERHDYQCVFRPLSPCVPTFREVQNAHVLGRVEARKTMEGWDVYNRVVVMELTFQPQVKIPALARHQLFDAAQDLLTIVEHEYGGSSAHIALLRNISQDILDSEIDKNNYALSIITNAIVLYCLRPHPTVQRQISATVRSVLPTNYNAAEAIGLPIRASDKCKLESECLDFDSHMQFVTKKWRQHKRYISNPFVVLTTESKDVLAEQHAFTQNKARLLDFAISPRFVTNPHDVLPGTGKYPMHGTRPYTADDAMISSLVSLTLQLHTSVTVGNCCSNFHAMLQNLVLAGCGQPDQAFHCLQADDDPLFKLCCGLGRTDCLRQRQQRLGNRTSIF